MIPDAGLTVIIGLAIIVFFLVLLGYVMAVATHTRRLAQITFAALSQEEQDRLRGDDNQRRWVRFGGAVLLALIIWFTYTWSAPAQTASSRSFYDSRGSFAGSSVTRGRQTDYFDSRGSFVGSSFSQGTPSNPHGNRK